MLFDVLLRLLLLGTSASVAVAEAGGINETSCFGGFCATARAGGGLKGGFPRSTSKTQRDYFLPLSIIAYIKILHNVFYVL